MHITEQSLDRFIAIYERQFDEPITREDAAVMARRLVNMYRLFLRPLPHQFIKSEQGNGEEDRATRTPIE